MPLARRKLSARRRLSARSRRPLLTRPEGNLSIVGATATGKTALSFKLAEHVGRTELISVDAMAVYRGLDIGTAKPQRDQSAPPMHLVDVADPAEDFSVAQFQVLAAQATEGARRRGNLLIYVGGTGLYHRAAVDALTIPPRFPDVLEVLEHEADDESGLSSLYDRLRELDPVAASRMEPSNRRRIVRALEVTVGSGRPFSSYGPGLSAYPERPVIIGLSMPRELLDERLAARLDEQMKSGFLEEVRRLASSGVPLSRTASQAIGYRELLGHLAGEMTLPEALAEILRRLKSLARRQESWFRRDPRVVWLDGRSSALVDDAMQVWLAGSQETSRETAAR